MKGGVRFTDLHLRGRKAGNSSPFLKPASQECLSGSIFSSDGFERASAVSGCGEVSVKGGFEALHTYGKSSESLARHRSAPKGVKNRGSPFRAYHRSAPRRN